MSWPVTNRQRNVRVLLVACALLLAGLVLVIAMSWRTARATVQERLGPAAGEPATLLLNTDALVLQVDSGSARLTGMVRDALGQPVAGAEVHFQSSSGSMSPAAAPTGVDGLVTSTFEAGHFSGQVVITAQVQSLTRQVVLQVDSLERDETTNVLHLDIDAEVSEHGEPVRITAALVNASGQPIGGELITLFGSLGTISPPNALSDADGRVTATFTPGGIPGQARISALAGYATASDTLRIEVPATPPGEHAIYLPLVSN
jgi:hypothetical protein